MQRLLPMLLVLGACTNVLRGDAGFTAGRTTIVPCDDKPGALIVVEALEECWLSAPGERLSCGQWRQILAEQPQFCSDEIVFDSPSTTTLTGFFAPPIDRDNLLGSATTQVFDLPCNPRGPNADNYDDFADFLGVWTGDVRVTRDTGFRATVEVELYPTDASTGEPVLGDPALKGTLTADVCR